jgi:hypothetical protein
MTDSVRESEQVFALEEKILSLEEELAFIKRLWTHHSMSMVCDMKIKTKDGKKVWVNVRDITHKELLGLDQDDDVREWISDTLCPFDNKPY